MTTLTYTTHKRIILKGHAELNEKWLQDRIAENPAIIGLGEIELLDRERQQDRAGRLDLLLADTDADTRYEVELMLGATDESHIIRCLEYWDIERRRYPAYDHCAVLVAEDITSRFLNVLALLAGTLPLIAIQLQALSIDDKVILSFTTVLDQRSLRRDDVTEVRPAPSDRAEWVKRSSATVMQTADEVLKIINQHTKTTYQLNFNRHYIGLSDGVRSRNFIHFQPRRNHLRVIMPNAWNAANVGQIQEAGLEAEQNNDRLVFNLTAADLKSQNIIVTKLIAVIVEQYEE